MVVYGHYQVCIMHNSTCYTSLGLAAPWVWLQQHHHKHGSNVLCSDITLATMLLGNRNFSAYGTTLIYAICH